MKKLICIIMTFMLVFSLTACGGSEGSVGVTVINNLGVELVDVKVGISDGSINGIILAETLADGESAAFSLLEVCDDTEEGWINIIALDNDANIYKYIEMKVYDGVEITLSWRDDLDKKDIHAEYSYNDIVAEYDGDYVPYGEDPNPDEEEDSSEFVDEEESSVEDYVDYNALIEGTWLYSDDDVTILYFDGIDGYVWDFEDTRISGTYYYDGETISFDSDDDDAWSTAFLDSSEDSDGYIFVEGDAGSYYYREEE